MKESVRGFTLLELLLVVGIASVLIVSGITLYNAVYQQNAINEGVRIVNMIIAQTKRMNPNKNYGAIAADLEPLLARSANFPAKYINGTQIITPFNKTSGSVVLLASLPGTFSLDIALPQAYVPQIAAQFNPNDSNEITFIRFCGTPVSDGDPMPNVAEMGVQCQGYSGAALNFNVVTQ